MTPDPSTLTRPALEALCRDQAARLARVLELVDAFMAAGPYVEPPQKGQVYDSIEEIATDWTSQGTTQRGERDRRGVRARSATGTVCFGADGSGRESVQGVRRIHDNSGISEEADPDVIAALRALGCDMHEARRLAGQAQGDTSSARIADALKRRG